MKISCGMEGGREGGREEGRKEGIGMVVARRLLMC